MIGKNKKNNKLVYSNISMKLSDIRKHILRHTSNENKNYLKKKIEITT